MTVEEMIQEIDYQATEDIFLDDDIVEDYDIDNSIIEIEYDQY